MYDVFEALKTGAVPGVALHGDFVRADGKGVYGSGGNGVTGGGGRRKQLRREQLIDNQNCVIRIYSNKKHTWQKDYV